MSAVTNIIAIGAAGSIIYIKYNSEIYTASFAFAAISTLRIWVPLIFSLIFPSFSESLSSRMIGLLKKYG